MRRRLPLLLTILVLSAAAYAQTDLPAAPSAAKGSTMSKAETPAAVTEAPSIEAPLTPGGKFKRFLINSANPYHVVFSGFRAGLSQAADTNSGYGQGAEGYGKRFGAAMADQGSGEFFGTFLYPVMFRQDPRYFRRGTGTKGSRIGYAISRVFVTRGDSGEKQFNISKVLGCLTSAAVSNAYYPDEERTAGKTMARGGINLLSTAGFNIVKEFLPGLGKRIAGGK